MIHKLFFHKIPVEILFAIQKKPQTGYDVARTIKCTVCYAYNKLKIFEKYNLVESTKKGKFITYNLTKSGEKATQALTAAWHDLI